jgi:hypothetical protein
LKSLSAPLDKCGNDSDTIDVNVGVSSDCALSIKYNKMLIVFDADVPPQTALILFVIPSIFFVAVVAENSILFS